MQDDFVFQGIAWENQGGIFIVAVTHTWTVKDPIEGKPYNSSENKNQNFFPRSTLLPPFYAQWRCWKAIEAGPYFYNIKWYIVCGYENTYWNM